MKRIAVIAALALAACGPKGPMVRNEDLSKHLESQGYNKILIRDQFSCGRMGKGRHFIATKDKKVVTGQICFLKQDGKVSYKVDELGSADPKAVITNPWKKN